MAQTAPQMSGNKPPSPDIDALLSALNAEASAALPGRAAAQRPSVGEQAAPAISIGVEPPTAALPERQAADPAARRVQALVRAFDVLHKQVAAIASQGETISTLADAQARQEQTLGELQRTMRYLRAVVIQQLQGTTAKEATTPALQVKLVVGHLAESYRQAQQDAGVLTQWAMLFAGISLGASLGAAMGVYSRLSSMLLILGTAAILAFVVASIFLGLARQARQRADQARRAMNESTLERPATG